MLKHILNGSTGITNKEIQSKIHKRWLLSLEYPWTDYEITPLPILICSYGDEKCRMDTSRIRTISVGSNKLDELRGVWPSGNP